MKRSLLFCSLAISGLMACNNAADHEPNDITGRYYLPAKVKSGEGACVSNEFVFSENDKPTAQCHASTIVETPAGLLLAYFGGTHEGNKDVGILLSRMENGKWTKPVEIINGVVNDTLRYPCWNPVLFQVPGGDLLLFYKVGPGPQTWWGMLTRSSDNGKTWAAPVKMGTDEKVGDLLGPIKNKPLMLADGTLISPTSIEYPVGEAPDQDWRVYFEISRDTAKTWEVIGPINDGKEFDAIQPSILQYKDGRMQVICRTRQNVLSESWSVDKGRTWSPMTAMDLPNPNSGTDAVTLADGRQLLVYNHSTREGAEPRGRNILNVAISDDGKKWTPVMTLENEPIEDGYAYPFVIQSADNKVHITYTYNRREIKHAILDPEKLF